MLIQSSAASARRPDSSAANAAPVARVHSLRLLNIAALPMQTADSEFPKTVPHE
jgi:hypothetical protein